MPALETTDFHFTYHPRPEKLEQDEYTLAFVWDGLTEWADLKPNSLKYGIVKEAGESSDTPTHLHFAFRLLTVSRCDNVKQRLVNYLWKGKPDWDVDEWKRTVKVVATKALAGTVAGYFAKERPDDTDILVVGFTDEEIALARAGYEKGVAGKARKDCSVDKMYDLIAQKLREDGNGDPDCIAYRERVDDAICALYMDGYRFGNKGNKLFGAAARLLITATYRALDVAPPEAEEEPEKEADDDPEDDDSIDTPSPPIHAPC